MTPLMTISRRTIATAAAAVALISWAGISAAQEEDPTLSEIVEEHADVPAQAADALQLAEQKRQGPPEETEEVEEIEAPEVVEEIEVEVEGERPLNHGYYVSEATATCPESGRERGECISAVAQSDEGKPEGSGPPEEAGRPEDVPRGPKPGKGPQG